jgi:chromosome segregation ATPase
MSERTDNWAPEEADGSINMDEFVLWYGEQAIQIRQYKAMLETKNRQMGMMQKATDDALAKHSTLLQQMNTMQSKLSEAEKQNADLRKTINQHDSNQAKLDNAERVKSQQSQQLQEYAKENSSLKSALSEAKKQLSEKEAQLSEAEKQLSEKMSRKTKKK